MADSGEMASEEETKLLKRLTASSGDGYLWWQSQMNKKMQ